MVSMGVSTLTWRQASTATQKARMTCGSLHYDACYTRGNGKSQRTRARSRNRMAKSDSYLYQWHDWRGNSDPAREYCAVAGRQKSVWIHPGGVRSDLSGTV